jgi:CHAT domain-containing protein
LLSSILLPESAFIFKTRMPTRHYILLSIGLFAVLVGVVIWGNGRLARHSSRAARRIEGRLTAGRTVPPNPAQSGSAIEAATGERSPDDLRRRGTLHLSLGQAARAVQDLEEAAYLKPQDGRLLSDLAAAYLARASERSNPFDLILALSTSDRALRATPTLPEARFNHALTLERLHLREAARQAWEVYLELDATSDWAREARARHAALAGPSAAEEWEEQREKLDAMAGDEEKIDRIVAQFPQETRLHTEEALLGSWADAVKAGRNGDAARSLAVARRIGASLAARYGEWMPADAVAAIDSAMTDSRRRAALIEGHLAYREARTLHESMRASEARPLFERARRAFAFGRSPVESLADLYLAVGQFQHFLYSPALATLRRIAGEERSQRSPGLLARVHRTIGLLFIVDGRPADAVDAYRKALAAAKKAGALEDVAGIHAILAESFRYLGRPTETWSHLYAALALIPEIKTPRRLSAVFFETAEACSAAGEPAAERYFRDEAIRVTTKAGEPTSLANALLYRAWTFVRLGDLRRAGKDIEEAKRIAQQVPDEPQRLRLQAYLLIIRSEVDVQDNPEDVVQDLTWALEFFTRRGYRYYLRRLYLTRARAELALGREDRAEEDLQRGIAEYELERGRVTEEPLRISFFDQADSLFDEMERLQARRPGGAEKALDYAERKHARALLDRLHPLTARQQAPVIEGFIEPETAREIQRGLPEDVALVEYAVLKDRLFAWVVRADGIGFRETRVESYALDELVKRLRASLSGNWVTPLAPSATALYDLLIRPILPGLQAKPRIVFVPDGSLNSVPFAALLDRASGRFLVQDRILAVAPSATVYVHSLEQDDALRSRGNPTALLVANPSFNRELAPGLPDLPKAESEAAAVAALFPGSEVLPRKLATRSAFLSAAGRHEILHFGGHTVVNWDFPLLSHLMMTPEDDEDSGLLYAYQLYGARFDRTRLAVLAGCSTADGPIQSEGPLSLARAFLAVGIPGVVASLWQVDDQETAGLLQIFYERLRRGDDAATALQHAQLALLSSSGTAHPGGTWAAFEVFGTSGYHYQRKVGEE